MDQHTSLRRQHPPAFKAKVAIEANKGDKTIAALSTQYGVHPTQIKQWQGILEKRATTLFKHPSQRKEKEKDRLITRLYEQVGKLQVQTEWLKKKLGISD
jgi:transposase